MTEVVIVRVSDRQPDLPMTERALTSVRPCRRSCGRAQCCHWKTERDGYRRASRALSRRYFPYLVAARSRASISEGVVAR
jgi:hypothetical protein